MSSHKKIVLAEIVKTFVEAFNKNCIWCKDFKENYQ